MQKASQACTMARAANTRGSYATFEQASFSALCEAYILHSQHNTIIARITSFRS